MGSREPLASEVASLLEENRQLRARLDTLPIIEEAKGILMLRFQIDADAAFNLLRRWSSHTNRKLRDLSRLIVDACAHDAHHARCGPGLLGPTLNAVLIWLQSDRHLNQAGSRPTPDPWAGQDELIRRGPSG